MSCLSSMPFALNCCTYFALNTLLSAFTENKYLLLLTCFCHLPILCMPPPGTTQCKCGCNDKFWPQVCNTAIIPNCISLFLPNWCMVCHTALNKLSYTTWGWQMAKPCLLYTSDAADERSSVD